MSEGRQRYPLAMCGLALVLGKGHAQESRPTTRQAVVRPAESLPSVLSWPRDRDVVLVEIDGKALDLGELVEHLRDRYDPRIEERWGGPSGRLELNSGGLVQLVDAWIDVHCLAAEAKLRDLTLSKLGERVDSLLDVDFAEVFTKRYEKDMKREIDPASRQILVARHRRQRGLELERRALLDILVPAQYKTSELREFYRHHGRWFGGRLRIAHILLATRDSATGRYRPRDELARVQELADKISSALAENPGRFATLAKEHSAHARSARRGGELDGWLERFDSRLPAAIVRKAWQLGDGAVAGPIETRHGLHFVRRLRFTQPHFILFHGKQIQRVREVMQRSEQEDFLFATRERHRIRRRL